MALPDAMFENEGRIAQISLGFTTEVEKELSRSRFNTKPKARMASLSGLAGEKVSGERKRESGTSLVTWRRGKNLIGSLSRKGMHFFSSFCVAKWPMPNFRVL